MRKIPSKCLGIIFNYKDFCVSWNRNEGIVATCIFLVRWEPFLWIALLIL